MFLPATLAYATSCNAARIPEVCILGRETGHKCEVSHNLRLYFGVFRIFCHHLMRSQPSSGCVGPAHGLAQAGVRKGCLGREKRARGGGGARQVSHGAALSAVDEVRCAEHLPAIRRGIPAIPRPQLQPEHPPALPEPNRRITLRVHLDDGSGEILGGQRPLFWGFA